ncbi:MAG: hypothetical protein SVT56_04000 [Chloroflexota bacterium]|nr:hypothetical protein [Chloroflexota bacterium]
MSYPFTIIGTLIFIAYIAVVFVIVVLPMWILVLKEKSWKWWFITPVSFLLIATPVVEELWIQHKFENLCKDAGIHIQRKVYAYGYFDSSKNDIMKSDRVYKNNELYKNIKNSGFRYIERKTNNGKVRHIEITNGKISETLLNKPESQYYLINTHNHVPVAHRIVKMQWVIKDMESNEIIGRDTKYARYPSFVESLWVNFIGDGQEICRGTYPNKQDSRKSLESYVFKN